MDDRQKELERLMLEYEKQCLKDLQKTYTEALADVKRNLRGLLGSEQTQSIVYQVQFQEQLQSQIENALNLLKNGSLTSVSDFLNKTYGISLKFDQTSVIIREYSIDMKGSGKP